MANEKVCVQKRNSGVSTMLFHKKIEKAYKAQLFCRYDDSGLMRYFSHQDFDGLLAVPYPFTSSMGHTLQGWFYAYDQADDTRLVIFDHGLGGGHRAYMKEIEHLCRAGYRVFAYDHTGCMASGGVGANGFAQSLHDLDNCLKTLKADGKVPTEDISVIGHSWGGFSTMNIAARHPDVKRVVVMSGFTSVERMIAQNFGGPLKGYRKHIMALESAANPDYVGYDGVTTLQNAAAKALLIYSDNDPMVHKAVHYDPLYAALKDKPGMEFLLVAGKGHNPNYTADAVAYLGTMAAALPDALKLQTPEEREVFKNSYDWERMTAQDETVWARILSFLA